MALTKALRECHGAVDWPEGRELAVWPYCVTGCNLLFHRQTALDIGLFRTDLGRRGRWMGDYEDLEFIDRARQAGHQTPIEPAAIVSHPVYRPETTLRYFVRQGRPYTLVLTKTQELFTREHTVRSQATADLAWLRSLRNG
ncbi:hypothetical protein [Streptomyces sp. NPDC005181]|uniref:glycosyltransferase family 2 protein n=1 Tax=Streptomyces sp. NPDC005181 TaxID=3156869 RepID=UPI0033A056CF